MGNLMPYNMYAAIGGGTLTFQQHQPIQQSATASVLQQRYEQQSYFESHLIPNCAGHPRIRNPNHRMCDNSVQGALYCQSGYFLEILDDETAEADTTKHISYIRGTKTDRSKFNLLEFISVAIGLVSIRGKESQRYLCMNSDGKLYGCTRNEFSAECIFKEEMLENLFNLYSSCSYGSSEKPWYVALKRDGRPKRGKRAKKKKKSSHFMFVKYDDNKPNEFFENFALLRRQNGAHSRPIRYVEDHGNGKSISELQPLNASIQAMLRALNATKTGGNLVVKQLDTRNIIRNSYKQKQKLTRIQKDNKRREERKKELQLLRMNAKYEGSQRSQNITQGNDDQQQKHRQTLGSNTQQQRFKLGNYSGWYTKWKHPLPDQYKNR